MELRKHNPQNNQEKEAESLIERRFAAAGLELRKSDKGNAVAHGYALRFGSIYDMGWFTEEVSASALSSANLDDVRILFNHDPNQILGRTAAKTARVGIDKEGLWYEVDLPDSPNGENARAAIERGDVTQSSWGFSLLRDEAGKSIGDKWEVRNGKKHRMITAIDTVYDASPVVYPANPDTSIAKRSFGASGIEKRDDGENMGDTEVVTPVVPDGTPADTWDLQWMISNLIWATSSSNDMVASLNSRIDTYDRYAKQDLKESPIFENLSNACKGVKKSIVVLLESHIDALKTLNASENRAANSVIVHETNTLNPDSLAIDLELIEAEIRFKNLRYEYEKNRC